MQSFHYSVSFVWTKTPCNLYVQAGVELQWYSQEAVHNSTDYPTGQIHTTVAPYSATWDSLSTAYAETASQ